VEDVAASQHFDSLTTGRYCLLPANGALSNSVWRVGCHLDFAPGHELEMIAEYRQRSTVAIAHMKRMHCKHDTCKHRAQALQTTQMPNIFSQSANSSAGNDQQEQQHWQQQPQQREHKRQRLGAV